tara:strand:- start:240 stop:491 length:252 start_codon:yes stop_codon:yes gene_type:complete
MSNFSYIDSDSNNLESINETESIKKSTSSPVVEQNEVKKSSGMFIKFCLIALLFLIFGKLFTPKQKGLKNLILSPQELIRNLN